jgi:hypothetical protein
VRPTKSEAPEEGEVSTFCLYVIELLLGRRRRRRRGRKKQTTYWTLVRIERSPKAEEALQIFPPISTQIYHPEESNTKICQAKMYVT